MTGTQPDQRRRGISQTQPERDPPPFPKPERPNENEPMRDPPVIPPRDGTRKAHDQGSQPASDGEVIFDANEVEK